MERRMREEEEGIPLQSCTSGAADWFTKLAGSQKPQELQTGPRKSKGKKRIKPDEQKTGHLRLQERKRRILYLETPV